MGGGGDVGPTGKDIYDTNCLTCHGATGKGDGPVAVGLDPPPADLTDGVWKYGGSQTEIENTIREGVPDTTMAAWKSILTEEEIKSVAEYVKSLSQ
ncbi:MAG: c-type cytochrome [Candidatus Hydrothermarchaeales archaeon]